MTFTNSKGGDLSGRRGGVAPVSGSVTPKFQQIVTEYEEADAAYKIAQARADAAGLAYVRAQCRELIDQTATRRLECTLEKNHPGEHVNTAARKKGQLK